MTMRLFLVFGTKHVIILNMTLHLATGLFLAARCLP